MVKPRHEKIACWSKWNRVTYPGNVKRGAYNIKGQWKKWTEPARWLNTFVCGLSKAWDGFQGFWHLEDSSVGVPRQDAVKRDKRIRVTSPSSHPFHAWMLLRCKCEITLIRSEWRRRRTHAHAGKRLSLARGVKNSNGASFSFGCVWQLQPQLQRPFMKPMALSSFPPNVQDC